MLYITIAAYKLFVNLSYSSLIRYFTLERVSPTVPTNKEKPRHFLVYCYITVLQVIIVIIVSIYLCITYSNMWSMP